MQKNCRNGGGTGDSIRRSRLHSGSRARDALRVSREGLEPASVGHRRAVFLDGADLRLEWNLHFYLKEFKVYKGGQSVAEGADK